MNSKKPIKKLNQYLSTCENSYNECIDVIDHEETINGVQANLRFHLIKFDGNGQPMIGALAETLYNHIIDYCISAKNRPEKFTAQESSKFSKQARKLFRHPKRDKSNPDTTGEAGEILLYFLLESVLKAPQVVAKMDLKTNHSMESNGSDGVHMNWNKEKGLVDVFFGEAKLHQSYGGAIKDALKSINEFHDKNIIEHEFWMVTKHFKYSDSLTQEAVVNLFESGKPSSGVRINHACLIGYNSKNYKKLPTGSSDDVTKYFKEEYLKHTKKITKSIQKNFDKFDKKHLNFEVFFIPFPTVQEFRDAFNKALD